VTITAAYPIDALDGHVNTHPPYATYPMPMYRACRYHVVALIEHDATAPGATPAVMVALTGVSQPEDPTDYRPPSIADGTVSQNLIDVLTKLMDAYGAAGLRSVLDEMSPPARQEEALLGYATNRQLVEELAARYALGSTQAGYSTMTGDRFPADRDAALYDPLEGPTEDIPEHHDPVWDVPDEPWAPTLSVHDDGTPADDRDDRILTAVFQAIGGGSMCWEHVERAGVFHSTQAKWIGDGLVAYLKSEGAL
jgi:hypothetical protein